MIRLAMLRLVAWVVVPALCWAALIGLAMAHTAPSGWSYDLDCCNTMDCGPAAGGQVREERRDGVLGYAVRIPAGGHHHYRGVVDAFVPMGDPRIRVSGDADRHVCLTGTGRLLCIYVPPGGV